MTSADNRGFESFSPDTVTAFLTIANFPDGQAIMRFNNQTYEVTVKPLKEEL